MKIRAAAIGMMAIGVVGAGASQLGAQITSAGAEEAITVTVGLLAPQSGFAANYGPEAQQGIDLALAELGDDAAVQIELVIADEDVLDPSQTLERVKKLVESDGVDVVIGPVFGSSQQAVAPYLTQQGIPMFAFMGARSSLATDGSAFIWPGADEYTATPMGEYAGTELGYTKVATLAPDYAYGQDVIAGAVAAFEATGGEVVQQQWVPLGTTDMLQYATSMDQSVDALIMWLVPADAATFVREYRNLGIDVPLLMIQGVFDPTFQEIGTELVGELGMNEYNPGLDNERNVAFVEAYGAAHDGAIPNQTTAFAYTVMDVVAQGAAAAGGDMSLDSLRAAVSGIEFETVIGPATYSADGIAASNRYIVEAAEADGGFVWTPIATFEGIGTPSE